VLALSISNDERLRDVQSLCSHLSDQLEKVTRELGVLASEHSSDISGPDDEQELSRGVNQGKTEYQSSTRITTKNEPHEPSFSNGMGNEDREHADGEPNNAEIDFEKGNDYEDRQDIQILLETIDNFNSTALQGLDPVLAEYVINFQAWRMLGYQKELCQAFISAPNKSQRERVATSQFSSIEAECTRKLASLRKKAHVEGLENDLSVVDTILKVKDEDVSLWNNSSSIDAAEDEVKLKLPVFGDANNGYKERLTRTNEWLLAEKQLVPYLSQLQRTILTKMAKLYKLPIVPERQWERQIMKHWFLDIAAMGEEEYATSSIGGDSEATFRALKCDQQERLRDVDGVDEVDGNERSFSGRPTGSRMLITFSYPLPRTEHGTEWKREVNLPPDRTSQSRQYRAEAALQQYQQEPSAKSWLYSINIDPVLGTCVGGYLTSEKSETDMIPVSFGGLEENWEPIGRRLGADRTNRGLRFALTEVSGNLARNAPLENLQRVEAAGWSPIPKPPNEASRREAIQAETIERLLPVSEVWAAAQVAEQAESWEVFRSDTEQVAPDVMKALQVALGPLARTKIGGL
jgi:hypothetical protein